jgi:hypothetical protein
MFQCANGAGPDGESRAALPRFYRTGVRVTDKQLLKFAASFRKGILGDEPSQSMCAAVSLPLAALLRCNGVECETVESELSEELGLLYANHVWIRLADGRALDATADQFNRWGFNYPPVYLGAPTELHNAKAIEARAA